MAKLKKGIFGPISGQLGPIIGSTWKGIPYVKQAQKKRSDAYVPSESQLQKQHKMKFINELLAPFTPYLQIGFGHLALRKSASNVAFSLSWKEAVSGSYPNFVLDLERFCISKGNLPSLGTPALERISPTEVRLNWENPENRKAIYDDQVMLVAFVPELRAVEGSVGKALRRDKSLIFKVSEGLAVYGLDFYLSVVSMDRKQVSDSIYLGRMMPL